MPVIENIPVWTIPADWTSQVTQNREWMTDIMTSITGNEQRRQTRISPRVSFSIDLILFNDRRSYYDQLVNAYDSADWYFPIYPDVEILGANLAQGAIAMAAPVDSAIREFAVPGLMIFTSGDPFVYEVVSVTASDGVNFTLDPTASAWPKGTKVYPARKGRFTGTMPRATRKSSRVSYAQLDYILLPPYDRTPTTFLTSYSGFPVFPFPADESQDTDISTDRILVMVDGNTGDFEQVDTAARGFETQTVNLHVRGHSGHAAFWDWAYAVRGRLLPMWVSTYSEDIMLAAPVAETDLTMHVTRFGMADVGGPIVGRTDIEIVLRNGTTLRRPIVAAALGMGQTEILSTCAAIGVAFTPNDVLRISFIRLMRLDHDMVDLAHRTDMRGISTCALAFKSANDSFQSFCCPQGSYERGIARVRMQGVQSKMIEGGDGSPFSFRYFRSAVSSPPMTPIMRSAFTDLITANSLSGNLGHNAYFYDLVLANFTGSDSVGRTDIINTCGRIQLLGMYESQFNWLNVGGSELWADNVCAIIFAPTDPHDVGDVGITFQFYSADGTLIMNMQAGDTPRVALSDGSGFIIFCNWDHGVGETPSTVLTNPSVWAFTPGINDFVVKMQENFS